MSITDTEETSPSAITPQALGPFDNLISMSLDDFIGSRLAVRVDSRLFGMEVIFRSDGVSPDSGPRGILSFPVSDYRNLHLIAPLVRPIKTFGNLVETFKGRIIDVCNHN